MVVGDADGCCDGRSDGAFEVGGLDEGADDIEEGALLGTAGANVGGAAGTVVTVGADTSGGGG